MDSFVSKSLVSKSAVSKNVITQGIVTQSFVAKSFVTTSFVTTSFVTTSLGIKHRITNSLLSNCRLQGCCLASWLQPLRTALCGLVLCLGLLVLTSTAVAQVQLSPKAYKSITQAYEHLDQQQWSEASMLLRELLAGEYADYAKALAAQGLSQVAIEQDTYPAAIDYMRQALAFEVLPEESSLPLLHTLGQLYCAEEHWQRCINTLQDWMRQAPQAVGYSDHILLSQAHYQLEQWSPVIKAANEGFRLYRAQSAKKPPSHWYQLLVAAHSEQKQWRQAIRVQQNWLADYPDKPDHWRQLVAMHLQVDDNREALAVQRLAYERGMLTRSKDYRLLAQMLMQAGLPYQAAEVLEKAIADQRIKSTARHLSLISHGWVNAKEADKAIASLQQLVKLESESEQRQKYLKQLAHLYMQARQWRSAQSVLQTALAGVKAEQRGELQLLLGISRIQLKHYDRARQAFQAAAAQKAMAGQVEGWMKYLEQMQKAEQDQAQS